tara:strand:- start:12397 stop:13506 length:1110 start_codon:yes stop_codon:yes gene_type:complete
MSTTTVSSAMISSGVIPTVEPTRNFLLDGDYTNWPEGVAFASIAHTKYGPALWQHQRSGSNTPFDVNRSTNVPTIAQSGHQSSYSMEIDCTTAVGSPGSTDYHEMRYHVSGTDFAHLHQQTVTLNFWWYSTKTGTCSGTIRNSAQDRIYPFSFTVSSTNTWEEKSVTIDLDTSGTWLFTDADKGCLVTFNLLAGSGRTATAGSWGGTFASGASSTANHADSTSNFVRIAQVGLYKGSTAPSSFVGEPVATVKDQVSYYVQRWDYDQASDEHGMMGAGHVYNTSTVHFTKIFDKELRVAPSVTFSGSGTFEAYYRVSQAVFGTLTAGHIGKHGCRLTAPAASGTPFTAGDAVDVRRDGTDACFIMADARH